MTTAVLEVEKPVESVSSGNEIKSLEDFRVFVAKLHFNPGDKRAVETRENLLGISVDPAAHQVLEAIKSGLGVRRDDNGKLTRVELISPCASLVDEREARGFLIPDRPRKERKEGKKKQERSPLAPTYLNAYHLVEVVERPGEKSLLRFVLLETYSHTIQQGERAGQVVTRVTKLPIKFLARIITRWLRADLFKKLLASLRGGVAQEVAQMIGSYIGLKDGTAQASVGLPTLDRWNQKELQERYERGLDDLTAALDENGEPLFIETKPLREVLCGRFKADDPRGDELVPVDERWKAAQPLFPKRLQFRFVNSDQVVVYLRRWKEHGRKRVGLYVALPLANGQTPEHNFWWQTRVGEFTPLLIWGEKRLSPRQKVMLVPLSVSGGQRRLRRQANNLLSAEHGRFVRALNGSRQVCWSLLVRRDDEFYLQIATKRKRVPVARPNLLAVHLVMSQGDKIRSVELHWSLLRFGEETVSERGVVVTDRGSHWAGAKERRRRAYEAARRVVDLAVSFNADLALEKVIAVKKRSRDGAANARATHFNYSDLTQFISDKALDRDPPVRVWSISGFLLLDHRTKSPVEQSAFVAIEGQKIRLKANRY